MRPKFVWQPDFRGDEPVTSSAEHAPDTLERAALRAAGDSERTAPARSVEEPRDALTELQETDLDQLFSDMLPAAVPEPEAEEADLDELTEPPPGAHAEVDTLAPKFANAAPPPPPKRESHRTSYLLTVMVAIGVLVGSVLAVTPLREARLTMPRVLADRSSAVHLALDAERRQPAPPIAHTEPEPIVDTVIDLDEPNRPQLPRAQPEAKRVTPRQGPPRLVIEYAPYHSVPIRPGEKIGVFPAAP